jgi:hypothetical protein
MKLGNWNDARFVYWILTMCALFFYALNLSAQTSVTKADTQPKIQEGVSQLQCSSTLAQFSTLACEGKAEVTPTDVARLDIPQIYSTSLIWEEQILKFAQELDDMPTKNIRARAAEVLRESVIACKRVKQCENQALEYFGVGEKSPLRFQGPFNSRQVHKGRNEALAIALGEQLYESDAGILINRFTGVKGCAKLRVDAKRDGCDLPQVAR